MKVRGRYPTIWVLKKWISTTRCNFNSAGTRSKENQFKVWLTPAYTTVSGKALPQFQRGHIQLRSHQHINNSFKLMSFWHQWTLISIWCRECIMTMLQTAAEYWKINSWSKWSRTQNLSLTNGSKLLTITTRPFSCKYSLSTSNYIMQIPFTNKIVKL
jgi:hypothetical protein